MTAPCIDTEVRSKTSFGLWQQLADDVLAGETISREQALAVLDCPDDELLDLMAATYRVRRRWFGNQVQLYFLMNAKSGLCPEDCGYCSQSKVSEAEIPRYNLLSREKLLDGARLAAESKARTYCIVISARGPNEREMAAVTTIVPQIKQQFNLKICACLGLLTPEQAQELKECGVDRVNHNLNTSDSYYGEICTRTHSFADRLATLRAVRDAGMEMCSGGIIGMGERREDVVDLAVTLRDLGVQSIPVNFLNPDRRHAARRPKRSQSPLLPESAGDVSAREPGPRDSNRRRSRAAPWQHASTRLVRGQLDLRRRLPHHEGPDSRSRLSNDPRFRL